jgi:hypothetical protein
MFKKLCLSLIITFVVSALLFAGVYIEKFTVQSENGNVNIEWKTQDESTVSRFEVERKSGNSDSFIMIASVTPLGNNSDYQYIDRSAYKTTDALYVYRLKIIDKNSSVDPVYTNSITITHKVSSVKSTWGSIKSMFR